ncbi:MAG: hypothetical protein R3D98_12765 [Candidatus Krumholzibacteriia bacterium]
MRRGIMLVCGLACLAMAAPAAAKDAWVSLRDLAGGQPVCLQSNGQTFEYTALGDGQELHGEIGGPRRLKITSRYLFADGDEPSVAYTVTVTVDGQEVLSRRLTGKPYREYARCRGEGAVASLRRAYVTLPEGSHQVTIRVQTAGRGQVALRAYRQVKRKRETWMAIAPEVYDGMRHLEFESGNGSEYYHFDAGTPLLLRLSGPTTLRIRTRLDFDHTMNGSQTYTLEVLIDGEPWRTVHHDSVRLNSALWLESPDILPGDRKEIQVPVPRGAHQVEIRCVRPEACGVAAVLHIPKRDLAR